MKGFEWLLEEPDLNRPTRDEDYAKFMSVNRAVCYDKCEPLLRLIAREASVNQNLELLKFAIMNGFNVNSPTSGYGLTPLCHTAVYDCQQFLIDRGAKVTGKKLLDRSVKFIHSCNLARSSAILTLYVMQEMNKKYKNVSKIIARVVWESRGQIDEWLKE